MTKFKLTLTQLILSTVNIVLLFIPGFFTRILLFENSRPYGTYTVIRIGALSYFTTTFGGDDGLLFILTALALIACIVFSVWWLVKRMDIDKRIQCGVFFLPIAIILLTCYIIVDTGDFEGGLLCYLSMIPLAVNFILALVRAFAKIKDAPPTIKKATSTNIVNITDELKSLKDLLDSGIITQEEFDAKKKQVLGL